MKKVFLPIAAAALFIVVVGLLTKKLEKDSSIKFNNFKKTEAPQKFVSIGETKIEVEVADTNSERRQGLSKKDSLAENRGMLFVFDQKGTKPVFWMKDMRIAIDILWISDSKIIQIDKNVPPPADGTSDKDLKLYTPKEPVDYVLEVNTGFSDKNEIKEGDQVDLSNI